MKISRKSIGSLRPGDETGSVPGRHRSLRTAPSGYPLEATWRIEPSSARPDKSLRTRRDPRELHDHLTLQSPRWLNSGRENGSTSGRDQHSRLSARLAPRAPADLSLLDVVPKMAFAQVGMQRDLGPVQHPQQRGPVRAIPLSTPSMLGKPVRCAHKVSKRASRSFRRDGSGCCRYPFRS